MVNAAVDSMEGGSDELSDTSVGCLCSSLPSYVTSPPIEAVVFAWGVNEDGQLGLDADGDVRTPKVVEALLGTRFRGREFAKGPLVLGSRNSMAIEANGQVLSWGWNARGTLGQGTRGEREGKPRRVRGLRGVNIVQAALGGWHAIAVDERGQAYAWGGNEYGQCGVKLEERDVVHPHPCVPDLRVKQVACGGMHTVVLTHEGEVWTWGEPWGDFSMAVDRRPKKVEGATGIAKVVCGAFHNLALTMQGDVLAWGINDFGQLGTGDTGYSIVPVPVEGLGHVRIADVEAGGWHSLALSDAGEVYVWGRGEYGRLGLGDKGGSSRLRPQRLKVLEGHVVVRASAGGTHSVVLTAEGRLFIWGRGSFGRLGVGSDKHAYSPTEVTLPGGLGGWRVIDVACGGRHTLALAVPDHGNLMREVTPKRWTTDVESVRSERGRDGTGGSERPLEDTCFDADSVRSRRSHPMAIEESFTPGGRLSPTDTALSPPPAPNGAGLPSLTEEVGEGSSPLGILDRLDGLNMSFPTYESAEPSASSGGTAAYRRYDSDTGVPPGVMHNSPQMAATLSAAANAHDLHGDSLDD